MKFRVQLDKRVRGKRFGKNAKNYRNFFFVDFRKDFCDINRGNGGKKRFQHLEILVFQKFLDFFFLGNTKSDAFGHVLDDVYRVAYRHFVHDFFKLIVVKSRKNNFLSVGGQFDQCVRNRVGVQFAAQKYEVAVRDFAEYAGKRFGGVILQHIRHADKISILIERS